jgi:hypothetical protein
MESATRNLKRRFRYSGDRRGAERAIKKGAHVATPPGDRQAAYRELREQAKRHERGREDNLKRILELRRERQLHLFQSRDVAPGSDTLD